MGSGVGTISLILAHKNKKLKISSIENNREYINIAEENEISPADVCQQIGQNITGKPNKFKIKLDSL